MVEFTVLATILTLLVVGIVDFGMGFWNQLKVNAAAQDGAAYAIGANIFSATTITSVVTRGATTLCERSWVSRTVMSSE